MSSSASWGVGCISPTTAAPLAMGDDKGKPTAQATIDPLLQLMRERLLLMHDVARWKWHAKRAIADANREEAMLGRVVKQGNALGLDPKFIRSFFTAQIKGSKMIQRAQFATWKKTGEDPSPAGPSLATLRRRIDTINRKLLVALARACAHLQTDTGMKQLRDRIPVILRGKSIDEAVRREVYTPLLNRQKSFTPIVGHRGLIHHAPENTLAAFGACMELRVGFELDVRRSRDGHLVCLHDATINRTTNGTGNVGKFTLAELQKLDAGSWFDRAFTDQRVPTLEQVFAELKKRRADSILVAVDLKADDTKVEADAVRWAVKYGVLDQLLFIGRTIDEPQVRQRLRKASSNAHVAVLAQKPSDLQKALQEPKADWIYLRFLPTAAQVGTIHATGKRVFLAGPTVSGLERANWKAAIDAGVDGVLTDYPLRMRQSLRTK